MTALAVAAPARRLAGNSILAVTGAALGVVTSWFKAVDDTHPSWDVALSSASGYLFLVAGLVAAARRPDNRVGTLMMLTGIAGFAEDIQLSAVPVVHTVGLLLRTASTGVLAHLILAFPTGRVDRRVDRVIVAAAYVWSFLVMPLAVPFTTTEVPNLLQVVDVPGIPDLLGRLGLPLALATFIALAQRWYRTRPQLRHVLGPVVALNALIGVTAVGAAALWGSDLYRAFIVGYQVGACLLPLAFLIGLLRVRLGRTALSRLVEALSGPVDAGRLRTLLSRALGDPELEVAFPRNDGLGLIGADGVPVDRPAPGGRQVATDVVHDGRTVAVLLHNPALLDDDHVLRSVAAATGLSLENARLNAELRAQLSEVRRSRARIVSAGQVERERLERDLHDGVQAKLVAALIMLRTQAANGAPAMADRAASCVDEALADVRRISHGIRPAVLAEAGLLPALRALLTGSGLETALQVDGLAALDPPVEDTIYFVVAEALSNTLKHARATRFEVSFAGTSNCLTVQVRDDGRGGAVVRERGGLQGLQDRVQAVDGVLVVDSPAGGGTTLLASFRVDRK